VRAEVPLPTIEFSTTSRPSAALGVGTHEAFGPDRPIRGLPLMHYQFESISNSATTPLLDLYPIISA